MASISSKSTSVKYHQQKTFTYWLDIDNDFRRQKKFGKFLYKSSVCTRWLIISCLLAIGVLSTYKYAHGYFKDKNTDKLHQAQPQCTIDENSRFDCFPQKNGATQQNCEARGCCWQAASKPESAPYCFYPSNYDGYNVTDIKASSTGLEATLQRTTESFYPQDVKILKLLVEYQTKTRLRIKIYDPSSARYEVPLKVPSGGSDVQFPLYNVTIQKGSFNIVVKRTDSGATVFDTTNTAPLIFSDQFLQIATQLSSKYLYGLGEHRSNFLQNLTTWRRLVFWNADDVPKVDNNGYGTHPFFLNLEPGSGGVSDAHGVFLLNSNAGEAELQPFGTSGAGAVTFRQLGGILDFFILLGPAPLSVAGQFTDVVGRAYLPPFWSLGFHLCKWGYNTGGNLHLVIERNREAEIPYVALQPYGSDQRGAVTYRMLGGVLDFFIVLGPEPDDVVSNYADIVGRTYLPPFWSLGYHLCKYGITTDAALQNIINRNRDAKIPYDVQWTDIDYMANYKDWTYDKTRFANLPDIIKNLHDNQQRYILMADPAISSSQPAGSYPPFDDGKQLDIFIKNAHGDILIGQVWPGATAFPDFFHPQAIQYWYKQASEFHAQLPFDGLWIDMNEPSSFIDGSSIGCTSSFLDNPPYIPPSIDRGSLIAKTICPSAKQYLSEHYDLHNMYGWSQANVTRRVLDLLYVDKRSPIITRSTFPGTGTNAGHWLGDNESTFADLFYSIPGILNFNMFGIPQIGADICGFRGTTTPELCTRWHQLAVFYPFMRNHAELSSPDQDPASFQKPFVDYIRSAIQLRYRLLAVLYSAFYRAHIDGVSIVRPLFYLYPNTEAIDRQFMWTDQLLISPVVDQGATTVQAYIPDDVWYDFFNGTIIKAKAQNVVLDAPIDRINVHIRGGSVLPLLPTTQRTDESRKQKFQLLVAIDAKGSAKGELFWDDGESLDSVTSTKYSLFSFSMENSRFLSSTIQPKGYTPAEGVRLGLITFYGVQKAPLSVTVNGQTASYDYNLGTEVLTVNGLDVDLLQDLAVYLN